MTRICLILGLGFCILLPSQRVWAYPQFIGYKYSSCLTCHYNGNGNGPLNDYGRALWSAEIAGRLFAGNKTDEQLGESSGFLGSYQLPWWIRPGIKARQLYAVRNLGNDNSSEVSILMQADANVALFFDRDQKLAFIGSIGYLPERQQRSRNGDEFSSTISREHYIRWQKSENLWLYFGMLDKVYGIRHINHTAYSRANVGIAQNDQTHGVIGHYITPNWEWSVHGFVGNLAQDAERRQVGGSTMFEYEIKSAWRVGMSALHSSSDRLGQQRFAIHSRYGFGYGSAILFELGNIKNSPESGTSTNGYYLYTEAIQKVVRGYHVFVSGQSKKDDFKTSNSDDLRLAVGVLAFPMARTEFRIDLQNDRSNSSGAAVANDIWSLMLQAHLSL